MKKFLLGAVIAILSMNTIYAQEDDESANDFHLLIGIYNGYENNTYNFTYVNQSGEKDIVNFNEVSSNVLLSFNLKDNSSVGNKFEIAYLTRKTSKNSIDNELVSKKRTIIDLKPMRSLVGL